MQNHDKFKMKINEEYFYINSKKIETVWYGPSPQDAPTLVFLHHGLGCAATWHDYPKMLAAATQCGALVYSRFGYGNSDPCSLPRPVRFLHDEALNILPKLLAAKGVRDCILIGHSDGGSISIIYAGGTAAQPLRGVITEAAHVFFEDKTFPAQLKARESYEKGTLRQKLEKYHGSNTECAFLGWNNTWMSLEFADWDLREYLSNIKVPMLVIQGEDDEYGTVAQVSAIKERMISDLEVLMIPECGHSPHQEQEKITFQAMVGFIKKMLRIDKEF